MSKDPREKKRIHKVFIRMNDSELDQVRQNAELFEHGNLSRWMRNRALDVSVQTPEMKRQKK